MPTPPDFNYSAFHYTEILDALHAYARIHTPELSSGVDYDPYEQFLRSFSLVGHISNLRLDQVAREQFLRTARLPDTVRAMVELIDYRPAEDVPASADILLRLSAVLTGASTQVVVPFSTVENTPAAGEDLVTFEFRTEARTARTDRLSAAAQFRERPAGSGVPGESYAGANAFTTQGTNQLTNGTAVFNGSGLFLELSNSLLGSNGLYYMSGSLPLSTALLQNLDGSTPIFPNETGLHYRVYAADGRNLFINALGPEVFNLAAGHRLLFGHSDALFDKLKLTVDSTTAAGVQGVWEYWDADGYRLPPDLVNSGGGNLTFRARALLGPADVTGALATVYHLPSGASAPAFSTYAGGFNVLVVPGSLGQGVPSLNPQDYALVTHWTPLPDALDGTAALSQTGDVSWTLPQDVARNWRRLSLTVNGIPRNEYWVSFRVVAAGVPGTSTLSAADPARGFQYLLAAAVQGRTVQDAPLAVSDGSARQTYPLSRFPTVEGSWVLTVTPLLATAQTWNRVGTLAEAGETGRVYELTALSTGRVTVRFGDGLHGAVPPAGSTIRVTYRTEAAANGNVGAGVLTSNSQGLALVDTMTNPRPAAGWSPRAGSTPESLAALKTAAPASVRTLIRAVSAEDYETLTTTFPASPVVRARAFEERYGIKTVGLVVVGAGGAFLTADALAAVAAYFNGDPANGVAGAGGHNQEVTAANYTATGVAVTATVVWPGGSAVPIIQALQAALDPLALARDAAGRTTPGVYAWDFGGKIPLSRLYAIIQAVDPGIREIDITSPPVNIVLGATALPRSGTFLITVLES